jgi:hypothetical protein
MTYKKMNEPLDYLKPSICCPLLFTIFIAARREDFYDIIEEFKLNAIELLLHAQDRSRREEKGLEEGRPGAG